MLYKNLPWQVALWKIPVRLMLDAIAAWKGLLSGDGGFFISVLKAHIHFKKWLLLEKHPKGTLAKSDHFEGWYRGSIVWDYFIRKKKTFLEIIGNK